MCPFSLLRECRFHCGWQRAQARNTPTALVEGWPCQCAGQWTTRGSFQNAPLGVWAGTLCPLCLSSRSLPGPWLSYRRCSSHPAGGTGEEMPKKSRTPTRLPFRLPGSLEEDRVQAVVIRGFCCMHLNTGLWEKGPGPPRPLLMLCERIPSPRP